MGEPPVAWNFLKTEGYFKVLFDTVPCPVLVVDHDVRVFDYNRTAFGMLGRNKRFHFMKRGGEVLHCIHSDEAPEGCGYSDFCEDCVLRNSVTEAARGKKISRRRARMELCKGEVTKEIHLLVTAAPLLHGGKDLILLIFEDISDLIRLEKILPICSYCKKIRTGGKYWKSVEDYLLEHAAMRFSHSICDVCMKRVRKEIPP